ncbi:hypothetical protein TWF694_002089 [Orbilia ellipsospora]|uniref:Uncharacterized protein n=1 Tax=Orbilia ellipsospora TaxID=2528407 RepID=A0AAV9X7E4_9PEZI
MLKSSRPPSSGGKLKRKKRVSFDEDQLEDIELVSVDGKDGDRVRLDYFGAGKKNKVRGSRGCKPFGGCKECLKRWKIRMKEGRKVKPKKKVRKGFMRTFGPDDA